jgi:flagellar hook protein FlgE
MPFRTALSGLNASSTDLRVIGHNIANASTTGFKKSRTEFADVYPASNAGTSGNAVGAGVQVSDVAQQFSQGILGFTGNALDLGVNGQGFFMLSDGGSTVYSRSGSFHTDSAGYVENSSGQRLQVYQADTAGNITGAIGDLYLNPADIAPNATTTVDVGLNLDATQVVPTAAFNPADATSYNHSTSLTLYDSLGSSHLATMYYRKTAANNWDVYLYVDGAASTLASATRNINFTSSGALNTAGNTALNFTHALTNGAANLALTLDFNTATPITQYGSGFSVNNLVQDGYTTGRLRGVDVADSGIVYARYTNGQSRALGQVALANFNSPLGLRQLGDTAWAESAESGAALVGAPGTASLGLVQSGALEGSNVDLTEQLVNMITAQRNFQANAQVISTADTITQTIINIR